MLTRIGLCLLACLVVAACAMPDQRSGPDLSQGMWDGESIVPPTGLATSRQSDLVGRAVTGANGAKLAIIDYVLVDPTSGSPRYAVASSNQSAEYAVIPMSALQVKGSSVWFAANDLTLARLPHYTLSELGQRYPATQATASSILPPAAALPHAALSPLPGDGEPLTLAHQGSVVGYPVIDPLGSTIGSVDAVAAVPTTGEVRYVIISGPNLGLGNYIAAPASVARLSGDRLVLTEAPSALPRYRSEQLSQSFGTNLPPAAPVW